MKRTTASLKTAIKSLLVSFRLGFRPKPTYVDDLIKLRNMKKCLFLK